MTAPQGQKESDIMTTTKTTYVSTINAVLTAIDKQSFEGITAEHIDKLVALAAALEKRNASKSAGERKPTKTQRENELVKATIKSHMGLEPKQCKEIAAECELSPQKVSALLKQMVEAGEVIKTQGKGDKGGKVSLFRLA